MLFFFFAFDILNILYFYCFFYSFHNFVAFDRFVDLLCCYAQLDFTCSRVRPLKHCIIFTFFYSYFLFMFVLFPSSIFFLGKKTRLFLFCLVFLSRFSFSLAGYYLLVIVFVFLCYTQVIRTFSVLYFLFRKKDQVVLAFVQFFVAIFFFTCWLSLAGCHLLVVVFYVIHRLRIVFFFFFLLFFLAVFPC